MKSHTLITIMAACAVPASAAFALGKDHFLTIGGGPAAGNNQVSLEKNVLLFQRLLRERCPEGTPHDIFFGDGQDAGRDLQFYDPQVSVPAVQRLLGQVFEPTRYQEFQYRSSAIPDLRGASTRANLEQWFNTAGSQLTAGDRLIIYATAHGGRSPDSKQPQNTGLYLWNGERLPMPDLARWLDKVPPQVPVVAIMVQCYAGGFADIVFHEGDPAKGFTAANRCGFFATVQDRGAAGCTPDIVEEDYQEYSSYFWAAIRGRTRSDQPLSPPDYDHNRFVSFAEAHAYVMLASPTIDIPVKTSDAFLRHYSKLPDAREPLSMDGSFTLLLKEAGPVDAAVLEGLSDELQLSDDQRGSAARDLAGRIQEQKKLLDKQRETTRGEYRRTAEAIAKSLQQEWPELASRWHPRVWQIVAQEGETVQKRIESHPQFATFRRLHEDAEMLSQQSLDQERRWVKCQRLLRVMENVLLAANLPKVAAPDVQQRFQELVEAEAGALAAPAEAPLAVVPNCTP